MSAFLDALRAADKAASPAFWEVGGPFPGTSVIRCVACGVGWPEPEPAEYDCVAWFDQRTDGEPNETARADAALTVLLRNAAPEIAALVEAVGRLVFRCDGDEGVRADGSNIDTLAVHAALAALDAKVTP